MKNGVFMLCGCYEQYRPPRLPFHVLRRTSLKSGVFCTVHYTPHTTHHTPSNNTHIHFTHPTLTYDLYGGVHATTYVRHHRSQASLARPSLHSFIHSIHSSFWIRLFHCQSPFFNNHLRHEQTQHIPIGINCLARRQDDSPAGRGRRVRSVLAKA